MRSDRVAVETNTCTTTRRRESAPWKARRLKRERGGGVCTETAAVFLVRTRQVLAFGRGRITQQLKKKTQTTENTNHGKHKPLKNTNHGKRKSKGGNVYQKRLRTSVEKLLWYDVAAAAMSLLLWCRCCCGTAAAAVPLLLLWCRFCCCGAAAAAVPLLLLRCRGYSHLHGARMIPLLSSLSVLCISITAATGNLVP